MFVLPFLTVALPTIHAQTIVPNYFYHIGSRSAALQPEIYMRKHWGDFVQGMTTDKLQYEATTMIKLRKDCTKMALENLSEYTGAMASILNVKRTIVGCEAPVLDRDDWIESLVDNPTNEQLQKWIFAWMYVRTNYKKLVSTLKQPNENFEEQFMYLHNLEYDEKYLKQMKKNTKTCVRLLYNLRARSWRNKMINEIRDKLSVVVSVTAPREIRSTCHNYCRESSTFFIGKIVDKKTIWTEVS